MKMTKETFKNLRREWRKLKKKMEEATERQLDAQNESAIEDGLYWAASIQVEGIRHSLNLIPEEIRRTSAPSYYARGQAGYPPAWIRKAMSQV